MRASPEKHRPEGKETTLTNQEIELVRKTLKVDRRKAIDSVKKTVGKEDPAYQRFAGEYYEEIKQANLLLDRLKTP